MVPNRCGNHADIFAKSGPEKKPKKNNKQTKYSPDFSKLFPWIYSTTYEFPYKRLGAICFLDWSPADSALISFGELFLAPCASGARLVRRLNSVDQICQLSLRMPFVCWYGSQTFVREFKCFSLSPLKKRQTSRRTFTFFLVFVSRFFKPRFFENIRAGLPHLFGII